MYIIIYDILSTIQPVRGFNMGKLRNISGWIIAAALVVVLGALAAGCGKRVQEAGEEQVQKAEADVYDDEADFEFKVVADNKSVVITGYVGKKSDVRIPSTLQGLPVTEIERNAFNKKGIVGVIIPNSVITIGEAAFSENLLTSVTIPDGVTTLAPDIFSKNPLTELSVTSDNTAFIAKDLFLLSKDGKQLITYYGNAKDITIPDGVAVIGERAFGYSQLTSVVIPSSVTTIAREAFAKNHLTSVVIPNSVTTIGYKAFAYNRLTDVTISDNIKVIEKAAFLVNQLTSVVIPSSVTKIESWAFFGNKLTSVTIPNRVTVV
jgi:hypothetical protein